MNTAEGCFKASFSPQFVFEAVKATEVQQALRQVFETWGIPNSLRVDNGIPWGSKTHLPSPLCLWLIGLGIEVIHNRPFRPQENGKVERSHGVTKAWVEPHLCENLDTLQFRLHQAARIQREQYPSINGQTRRVAFPQLAHPARRFERQTEAQQWNLAPVLTFLAGHRWARKVGCTGQISWYGHNLGVGRKYKAQMINVHFDAHSIEWVMEDDRGEEIVRYHATGLNPLSICQLIPFRSKPTKVQKLGA